MTHHSTVALPGNPDMSQYDKGLKVRRVNHVGFLTEQNGVEIRKLLRTLA
jgi:hypothetical protein